MTGHDWTLEYSERFYGALLSLYPAPFRVRFGRQMTQVFSTCLRREVPQNCPVRLARWWLRTLKDLAVSIPREHIRELASPVGTGNPFAALIDRMLIPGIVTVNLAVMGPVIAALLLRMQSGRVSPDVFFTTSVIASLVLGGLSILRALVWARLRPTARLWMKIS